MVAAHDPALRLRLRELIESQQARVVAESSTGSQAVDTVCEHDPAVLVLDARLPDMDVVGVVEKIGIDKMPAVLFLTRLGHETLRVLELHGINYLLEPFTDDRFLAAFQLAERQAEPRALEGVRRRLGRMLSGDEEGSRLRRIPVRSAGQTQFIDLDDVRWVEGAGAFSRLHLDDRTHVVKATLDQLSDRFEDDFLRIHSTMVRSSEIAEIVRSDEGAALVTLRDGRHLRVTRDAGFDVVPAS